MSAVAVSPRTGRAGVCPGRPVLGGSRSENVGAVAPGRVGMSRPSGDVVPSRRMRLTARGRRAAVLVAILTLGVVLLAGRAAAADDSGPLRVEVYTVATGDTLWQIASRVTTPGEDIRDVVIRLEELNRMSSVDLWAGEQILIPALG
ncbi:cell division suppressor protein YneA [mine drainage metagenome]|uniref:Cell division suppressor protein YneA n=1 Tax=mine drainage metagenome TaxID=410659 RepID=A0A1J5RDP5_9ZZZZ